MRRGMWVPTLGWLAAWLLVARAGWVLATTPPPPGPITAWAWLVRGVGALLLVAGIAALAVPWSWGEDQ